MLNFLGVIFHGGGRRIFSGGTLASLKKTVALIQRNFDHF